MSSLIDRLRSAGIVWADKPPENMSEVIDRLKHDAVHGDVSTQVLLGNLFLSGDLVEKDDGESTK